MNIKYHIVFSLFLYITTFLFASPQTIIYDCFSPSLESQIIFTVDDYNDHFVLSLEIKNISTQDIIFNESFLDVGHYRYFTNEGDKKGDFSYNVHEGRIIHEQFDLSEITIVRLKPGEGKIYTNEYNYYDDKSKFVIYDEINKITFHNAN